MKLSEFAGSKILITGHTGFKGAWLSRVLQISGAEIHGISLAPEKGSLFSKLPELQFSSSKYIDIGNRKKLDKQLRKISPDVIIHMAAQPLVRRSYREPLLTFQTNVMGTANLLNSSLEVNNLCGVVVVTTDKVYRNVEKLAGYTEDEPLGGKDPYSASKAGTEMVVEAWRTLAKINGSKRMVSARSGNVIGGGDHAEDRLIPDIVRAFTSDTKVKIRNPKSLRPWQHVLDPLFGYLNIASKILKSERLSDAYNFGPSEESKLSVAEMAEIATKYWPSNPGWEVVADPNAVPESSLLWLSSEKSRTELKWRNLLDAETAIRWSLEWEINARNTSPISALDKQIKEYEEML